MSKHRLIEIDRGVPLTIKVTFCLAVFLIVFGSGHFLGQAYDYKYTSLSTCNERAR